MAEERNQHMYREESTAQMFCKGYYLLKNFKSSPTYGLSSVECCSHHPAWNPQVHSDYGAVRGIQGKATSSVCHKVTLLLGTEKGGTACITLKSGTACNGCSPMHTKSTPMPVNK